MLARILICFPLEVDPGLHAEAAQLALGLAALGREVHALGRVGAWRHALRRAQIRVTEFDFTANTRQLTQLVQEYEPQVIHAFGLATTHVVMPLVLLVGASGVVTLGHADISRLNTTDFRTVSTVFVPCEQMRELVSRRLPSISVATSGYALPPAEEMPATKNYALVEGLGMEEAGPMILLADHFSGEETETALCLIEAASTLAARIPRVQVVIAGDGERLGELEARAADVNNRLGRRVVILPGHRDDIVQLLALTTVAVGSGRFAAEAIGAGVATVTAGVAGLGGVFTEEAATTAQESCFGRHGRLEPLSPRALATEIVGLFSYPDYRVQFAAQGQRHILAQAERRLRAEQITAYYNRTAPMGTVMRSPQRITVILPDELRELLFTLPAVSALRAHYPLAKMRLITSPIHHDLLEQSGLAESVLTKPQAFGEWMGFLRRQWRPRADICLSFCTAAGMLAGSSLAAHRLGFVEDGGTFFYSDHVQVTGLPSPGRALTLATSLGVSMPVPLTPPAMKPETQSMVASSLLTAGIGYDEKLILLCPQADAVRAWPEQHWLALAQLLLETRSERIAVLGATTVAWPDGVIKVMPVQDSLVMATLLARADLVAAADSAPLHLADYLGITTVGLFGPTDPGTHSLPNKRGHLLCHNEYPCHPCGNSPCPERHCLHELTPAEVARVIAAALDGKTVETAAVL